MINLITTYYVDADKTRWQELFICLNTNVRSPFIDRVYVFVARNIKLPESPKIVRINFDFRPTFRDMFNLQYEQLDPPNPDDIYIIANSDIIFDNTIRLAEKMQPNDCYALTRWEYNRYLQLKFANRPDSQDAWVFKGKIKEINAPFTMGKRGCDNRLAHEIEKVGYNVINPSLTIKAIHLHDSQVRNYEQDAVQEIIQPPYKILQPCEL